MSGDEKNNAVLVNKIFEALNIRCPLSKFKRIYYETEKTSGEYDFNTSEFWQAPEYRENHWEVPIIRTENEGYEYEADALIRGQWVKITFEIELDDYEFYKFFVQSVITKYTVSY